MRNLMRRHRLTVISVATLLTLIPGALSLQVRPQTELAEAAMAQPTGTVLPTPAEVRSRDAVGPPKTTPPVGVRAIQPTRGGVPAFTVQDVETYVKANPHPYLDRSKSFTVEQIEFLTSGELATRLHVTTDLPDNRQVCLVTWRGSFRGPRPAPQPGETAPSGPAYTMGHQVFDAQTGNLLIVGMR